MVSIEIYKKFGLAMGAAFILAACGGGGGGITSVLEGLNRIIEYAQNGGQAPTKKDYLEAGISGINTDAQLEDINQVVAGLEGKDVDTAQEVQVLVNKIGPGETEKSDFTISHNGTTYGIVTSPDTGRVWLDKNLGAQRVCTKMKDIKCIGDFFQWGRAFDGHQLPPGFNTKAEEFTVEISESLDVTHGKFIKSYSDDWVTIDVNGSKRSDRWMKTDGSSICPVGFRVPTIKELEAETVVHHKNRSSMVSYGDKKLFNGFLKLGLTAGYFITGSQIEWTPIDMRGSGITAGYLWSSTPYSSDDSYIIEYKPTGVYTTLIPRVAGFNVRCIRDEF